MSPAEGVILSSEFDQGSHIRIQQRWDAFINCFAVRKNEQNLFIGGTIFPFVMVRLMLGLERDARKADDEMAKSLLNTGKSATSLFCADGGKLEQPWSIYCRCGKWVFLNL